MTNILVDLAHRGYPEGSDKGHVQNLETWVTHIYVLQFIGLEKREKCYTLSPTFHAIISFS